MCKIDRLLNLWQSRSIIGYTENEINSEEVVDGTNTQNDDEKNQNKDNIFNNHHDDNDDSVKGNKMRIG